MPPHSHHSHETTAPRAIIAAAFVVNAGIAGVRLWQTLQGGGGAAVFGSQFVEGSDNLLYAGAHKINQWEQQARETDDPAEAQALLEKTYTWRRRILGVVSGLALATTAYGVYELSTNHEQVTGSEIAWSLAGVSISGGVALGMSRSASRGASSNRDVWRHAATDAAVGLGQTAAMAVSYQYGDSSGWALMAPHAAAIASSGAIAYFNWPTAARIRGHDHNVFMEHPAGHTSDDSDSEPKTT